MADKKTAPKKKLNILIKRDGLTVPFNEEKITAAIWKAMKSVGIGDRRKAEKYAAKVVSYLKKNLKPREIPTVEGIQDAVEAVLIESGEIRLAREYIAYRDMKTQMRVEKQQILEKDIVDEVDKNLDVNALKVLKSRYLAKDEAGNLIESPKDLFRRVATHVALPAILYGENFFEKSGGLSPHPEENFDCAKNDNKAKIGPYPLNRFHLEALKPLYDRLNAEGKMKKKWSEIWKAILQNEFDFIEEKINLFFEIMKAKKFLPNTPALVNFGRTLGMGSACFVLDIEDSMEGIMETLKSAAFIFKSGGGVGYNFSKLRPEGDRVRSTSGAASGPISFMRMFDAMTDVVKQGGVRRGANMGIVNSNHPDIEKFIKAKEGNKALKNFNISVLLMPDFWKHYESGEMYPLVNPRNGKVERKVNPRALFDMIVYQAWESAEPGLIFFEKINEHNPFLEHLGPIVCTNPCGEVILYPNESCNLGSLNVHAFIVRENPKEVSFDWDGFKKSIFTTVEFLDNVIDINRFPLKNIEEMTLATRKIGLGVMGVGDALFALGLAYDNEEGLNFMDELAEFVNYWSKIASIELAKKRGSFPFFNKSFFPKGLLPIAGPYDGKRSKMDWKEISSLVKEHGLRNAYTTVIAPTGSISMIAGTSSGIEPVFSLVFEKNVAVGSFYYIDPEFEAAMKSYGIYDERLMREIASQHGTLQKISYLPKPIKKIFKIAHDLTPENHIRALGTFQRWVDSSISKTINFPANATVDDMKSAYILAYELGCKDVTVYRDSSIENQVLSTPGGNGNSKPVPKKPEPELNAALYPTSCPKCNTKTVRGEGCIKCPACGWGLCT